MIPEANLKISFTELSLKGQQIIAQQPEISYAQALAQVQRLKEISKVNQSQKRAGQILKGVCFGKRSTAPCKQKLFIILNYRQNPSLFHRAPKPMP
jgi:hypothetical protein